MTRAVTTAAATTVNTIAAVTAPGRPHDVRNSIELHAQVASRLPSATVDAAITLPMSACLADNPAPMVR